MSTGTIVAVSSPPGPGRRGVIRLSGPRSRELVEAVLRHPPEALPAGAPRGLVRGVLHDGRGEQPVLVLWMPGPHSYTREDVAELHLPGAPALLARALERLVELGARPAAPGEFTRRAFENGRIDLTRAEGVLELVEAATEAERRAATHLLEGGLAERLAPLREILDEVRALLEASLDFDEADTGHVPLEELERALRDVAARLEEALSWEVARQAPSALPRVLLVGAPNAGKSSLFNALAGGEALVAGLSGTTRDSLHAIWDLGAGRALLVDTPGLDREARADREGASADEGSAASAGPDRTAQRLAARERERAELFLWVIDARRAGDPGLAAERGELVPSSGAPCLTLWNQVDREGASAPPAELGPVLAVSARTGDGLAAVGDSVEERLGLRKSGGEDVGRELFERHRDALVRARGEVEASREALLGGVSLDLVAETLRGASAALEAIEGRTTAEDLLDRIFARFCLGK